MLRHLLTAAVVMGYAFVGAAGCGATDPRSEGPPYSLGACPDLTAGVQAFPSGSLTYDVTIKLPAAPVGAPVVFVFHGLGGSPERIAGPLGVDQLVADGAIAVLPKSASAADFEWDFPNSAEGNDDLQMFHDLFGCMRRQYRVDLERVWATGMSAGGLWTSFLILHASDWLTAAAPFSGGVIGYALPTARSIPVMLTWGGPDDTYAGVNFEAAAVDLSFFLYKFDHPVIECVHDGDHSVPVEAPAMLSRFFRDQRWGDADPFAVSLPPELPNWCRIRPPG